MRVVVCVYCSCAKNLSFRDLKRRLLSLIGSKLLSCSFEAGICPLDLLGKSYFLEIVAVIRWWVLGFSKTFAKYMHCCLLIFWPCTLRFGCQWLELVERFLEFRERIALVESHLMSPFAGCFAVVAACWGHALCRYRLIRVSANLSLAKCFYLCRSWVAPWAVCD